MLITDMKQIRLAVSAATMGHRDTALASKAPAARLRSACGLRRPGDRMGGTFQLI
jgi:hypothetical protein